MKRKRFKLSENIVKKVEWKFVDGEIVLDKTKYIDVGEKNGEEVAARTPRQELTDTSNDLAEQEVAG